MKGIGIKKDEQKSFEWFLKSAKNQNSDAQCWVAICYQNGENVEEKNDQIAFKWFLKSAKNGNNYAKYEVAKCYICGIGTDKNEQKALEWFLKSAETN